MSAKKTPAKKSAITAELAEQVRKANLANLIKKVKAGKTLTAAESKMIEEAGKDAGDSELVTTSRLAQIFKINRKTVAEWRKLGMPGIPDKVDGMEPLDEWRKWFKANPSAGHFDGKPGEDRETLLCRKLEVEIALKKIQLDEAEGRMIARSEVDDRDLRIGAAVAAAMRMLETELPQLCLGLTLDRSRPLVKDKVRQVQAILADGLSDFWKSHPEKK